MMVTATVTVMTKQLFKGLARFPLCKDQRRRRRRSCEGLLSH